MCVGSRMKVVPRSGGAEVLRVQRRRDRTGSAYIYILVPYPAQAPYALSISHLLRLPPRPPPDSTVISPAFSLAPSHPTTLLLLLGLHHHLPSSTPTLHTPHPRQSHHPYPHPPPPPSSPSTPQPAELEKIPLLHAKVLELLHLDEPPK